MEEALALTLDIGAAVVTGPLASTVEVIASPVELLASMVEVMGPLGTTVGNPVGTA